MTADDARDALRMRCAADVRPYLSESDLDAILRHYRLTDSAGAFPDDAAWGGAYDFARAEAEAWGIKAARATDAMDASTPENTIRQSQLFDHCVAMQRRATLRIMGSIAVGSYDDARC